MQCEGPGVEIVAVTWCAVLLSAAIGLVAADRAASPSELQQLYQRYFKLKDEQKLATLVYWLGVKQRDRASFLGSLRRDPEPQTAEGRVRFYGHRVEARGPSGRSWHNEGRSVLDRSKCFVVESISGKVRGARVFKGDPSARGYDHREPRGPQHRSTERFDVTRAQPRPAAETASRVRRDKAWRFLGDATETAIRVHVVPEDLRS